MRYALLLLVLLFAGCWKHVVDDELMVVKSMSFNNTEIPGSYVYFILDGEEGFYLYSDQEYHVGDNLTITKKEE